MQIDLIITNPEGTIESFTDHCHTTFCYDPHGARLFTVGCYPLRSVKSEIARTAEWSTERAR